MTPPARRDGTPDKDQQPRKLRASEIPLSNARPARRQNVSPKQVAESLGADWLYDDQPAAEGVRLQKVLAQAGVASRRHAEVLIEKGRVEVNGRKVTKQGVRVNPNVDVIRVDGVRIHVNEDLEYFILNKPRGVLSTMSDDEGRLCVGDIIAEKIASGQPLPRRASRRDAEPAAAHQRR